MIKEHESYKENVAPYLLGALPALEAEVFERHVMGCSECRDEVARLRPAVEALPRAVPQMSAPPALKESLMREVRGEDRVAAATPARPRRRLRLSLPIARPAQAWAAAASVMVAVVVGYAGLQLVAGGEGERVVSASVDTSRVPQAGASLIVPDEGDVAVLSMHGLSPASDGRVYVVWTQRGEERIFESSFNVRPDGSGKAAIEGIGDVDLVMVTREPSAGVSAPSEEPILTVEPS